MNNHIPRDSSDQKIPHCIHLRTSNRCTQGRRSNVRQYGYTAHCFGNGMGGDIHSQRNLHHTVQNTSELAILECTSRFLGYDHILHHFHSDRRQHSFVQKFHWDSDGNSGVHATLVHKYRSRLRDDKIHHFDIDNGHCSLDRNDQFGMGQYNKRVAILADMCTYHLLGHNQLHFDTDRIVSTHFRIDPAGMVGHIELH